MYYFCDKEVNEDELIVRHLYGLLGFTVLAGVEQSYRLQRSISDFVRLTRRTQTVPKFFGLFELPRIITNLEVWRGLMYVLACALLVASAKYPCSSFLSGLIFILHTFLVHNRLYLYCKNICGHKLCSLTSFLLIISVSRKSSPVKGSLSFILKFYLAVIFAASALVKLKASMKSGDIFGAGLRIHYVQFYTRYRHSIPLCIKNVFTVVIDRFGETLGRLAWGLEGVGVFAVFMSHDIQSLWFLSIIGFHIGVLMMMNIDFISFWSIPLVAVVVPSLFYPITISHHNIGMFITDFPLVSAYIFAQIVVGTVSVDSLKPLTCCNVFAVTPVEIPSLWFTSSSSDNIPFEHGNYCERELEYLPYATLWVSSESDGYRIMKNFKHTPRFQHLVMKMIDEIKRYNCKEERSILKVCKSILDVSSFVRSRACVKKGKVCDVQHLDDITTEIARMKEKGMGSYPSGRREPAHHYE